MDGNPTTSFHLFFFLISTVSFLIHLSCELHHGGVGIFTCACLQATELKQYPGTGQNTTDLHPNLYS